MDAQQISALAAVVSAFTTGILAYLTLKYVRLTSLLAGQGQAAREPSVFVDFELDSVDEVIIIIGNSGPTSAQGIRFDVTDNIPWREPSVFPSLASLPAFRDGLPHLAPGRSIRFRVGYIDWRAATEGNRWLNIAASYRGDSGLLLEHVSTINFGRYAGMSADSFDKPVVRTADAIERLVTNTEQEAHIDETRRESGVQCPACAGRIPRAAKKCMHCLEWLERQTKADGPRGNGGGSHCE